jgi:hypothetical protein
MARQNLKPGLLFACLPLVAGLANAGEFPAFKASELLPKDKLEGEHFRLAEDVGSDGFLLDFVLLSDFGPFHARGPGVLERRIAEISAIARLDDMAGSEAFKAGFADAAQEVAKDLGRIVASPIDTVGSLPSGVSRFFVRTTRAAKTGMTQLSDLQKQNEGTEPVDGPGSKLPGSSSNPGQAAEISVSAAAAGMTARVAADVFGYDHIRRMIALQAGADPYTTNTVLRDRLDTLSRAAFAGNLGITAIKSALPATFIVGTAGTGSTWVWETPPGDLRVANQEALLAMGLTQAEVDATLAERWLTLTTQTRLVRALEQLKGVDGRPAAIQLVTTVASEEQAEFVVNTVEMLARHHLAKGPLKTIFLRGTLMAHDANGALVVVAPVDYLIMSPRLSKFLDHDDVKQGERSVWLTGRVSPDLRQKLMADGWQINENLNWAPVPPQSLTPPAVLD